MNSSDKQNWQRRLEELEVEVNRSAASNQQKQTETLNPEVEIANTPSAFRWLNSARDWFNGLAPIGQVAVGIAGIMVGFSLLSGLIKVVSSLISIAIVGGVLYLGYKYIFAQSSKN